MKKTLLLLLLLMSANFLLAQDGYIEYIEPESDFIVLKKQLRNGYYQLNQIEKAFINFDYHSIEPYLNSEIKKSVKNFFNNTSPIYTWAKIAHRGPEQIAHAFGNFGRNEEINVLRLHSKGIDYKTLEVEYHYYVEDSSLVIYSINFRLTPYQNQLKKINLAVLVKADSLINSLRTSVETKNTSTTSKTLFLLDSLKTHLVKLKHFNVASFNADMSSNFGNLSWFFIFEKKYDKAILAAEKGVLYDEKQTWIYTNLALSNLLAGNKENALKIYEQYKNQITNTYKKFRELFTSDLQEAKAANLISENLFKEVTDHLKY